MWRRDQLVPLAAGLAVLLVALVVVVLLRSAESDGTRALEQAKVAQVRTTARSFDARVRSTVDSLAGLGSRPWELTPRNRADRSGLEALSIDPEAESGLVLVDEADRIVNGTLLRPGQLGSTYDPPGWEEAKADLAETPAVVLPVASQGATTELPSYAFAVAIRGEAPDSVRGAFVFESALTEDSAFSAEIQELVGQEGTTAEWRFLDSRGKVVATTTRTGLGQDVSDPRLASLEPGLHRLGDDLVASADVPSAGWRVVFTQDRDEFVEPLSAPLKSVGLLLVLVLLGVGLVTTVLLARRLRQAREERRRLLELNRSQEEFISVVSHELRTPVAGVLGFLQTSLDHWESMSEDERHHAVRRAFTNARRLQAMTRDVLDTESIEAGRFGYVRHELDLAEELESAVEAFGTDAAGHVDLTLPETAVVVDADSDRIQQVLANLLDNARKHSPPDSPIEVRLTVSDDSARITVEDHGSGIDPDQVERIFDKFVRGRPGAVSGTGLGLYISRRIVEAHDGRIWVASPPGGPTRFVVQLPRKAGVSAG
jgi:signal transduction histidine kinase